MFPARELTKVFNPGNVDWLLYSAILTADLGDEITADKSSASEIFFAEGLSAMRAFVFLSLMSPSRLYNGSRRCTRIFP